MSNLSDFVGSGGIRFPLAATNTSMGLADAAAMRRADKLPMEITTEGEYLELVSNVSVEHFSELSVSIWDVQIADVQTLANKISGVYWDKVDDKLYILTYDTVNELAQLASINTLTGSVTTLGSTFASILIDNAPELTNMSITRVVQGTGNLLVSITNATGQGSFELPIIGGSTTNVVSNILLGNVEPKLNCPYKIDDNLFLGTVGSPAGEGVAIADRPASKTVFAIVTDKGQTQVTPAVFEGGGSMGGYTLSSGAQSVCHIREWGDDVALFFNVSVIGRNGSPTYNKDDFHRMAIEVAVANGLRI